MTDYRELFENVADGLVVHDPDTGEILDVNDKYCRMHGYDRSELLGQSVEIVTADDWDPPTDALERIQRAREEGETRFEWCNQDADGDTFWVSVTLAVIELEGDERVLASVRDVTERRRQREELEYQYAVLAAQAEATIDGYYIVDEDREVVSYNDRFLEIWGLDQSVVEEESSVEALEEVHDVVAHPEQFRERVEHLYANPEEEARDLVEFADGRYIDRYTTPVVAEDGTYYGRLWVFRDVTEREERERELQRHAEQLREFAGVVSHDLQNPLGVAKGRLNLAAEECDSDHLDDALEALDRMEAIVEDTLTLARQGQRVEETEPVAVHDLARESWGMVETADATLELADEFTVQGAPGRLQHLLENLVANAIEHGGDDVTVRVGRLEADGFYLEDDGPGIPPEDREDVFDPGTTRDDGGTGFGLTIVRRVAEAHGWDVTITESEAGGARFEFTGVTVETE